MQTDSATNCQNCHGSSLSPLFEAPAFDTHITDRFTLARCDNCDVVSTLGATSRQIDDAYSADYYGNEASKFSQLLEKLLAAAGRRRARALLNRWRPGSQQRARVLDIGCGRGVLLNAFREAGANVTGIERETFPGRPDFVHIGSLTDEVFEGQEFDIVVIWHVLEHFTGIDDLLGQVRSHMAPAGLLVIAVPNFGSWQQRVFKQQWFHLDLPRHLLHFDPQWLGERITRHGFISQQINHLDLIQGPYGFIQSTMNMIFPTARNRFYALLKQQGIIRLPLLGWGLFALLLAPLAAVETLYSLITRQGATFVMIATTEPP